MNKNKIILWVVVTAIVIAGGYYLLKNKNLTLTTNLTSTNKPIKIGFIGPLTGDAASVGQGMKAAVELAVDEINQSGGINSRRLEVIYEDGQCSGRVASSAGTKLINIDKVPVILGGVCSDETLAIAPITEQSKTVLLSSGSSAPSITNAGDYIFRDYPSDLFQGSYAAEFTFNKLGKKKAAILYVNSEYGNGLKDVFAKKFKEFGGEIVAEEGYVLNTKDLRTQLTKIKSANPEIMYFAGFTDAVVNGLKQALDLGLNVPIFGIDSWDDPKTISQAGKAMEGKMYATVYSPLRDKFKADMEAKTGYGYGVMPGAPQAYDAVKILAQVMSKVGTNPEAIKNELYKVNYIGGVSADKISFDSNGDLVGANYRVKIIKNGKAAEYSQ